MTGVERYDAIVVPALPLSRLGEGPVWDAPGGSLYWVDIESARICRLNPLLGEIEATPAPELVSALIPCSEGGWIVAAFHSLYAWEGPGEPFREVAKLELPEHIRFNDGKAGPDGAIWVGTMNMRSGSPDGCLYRVTADLSVETMIEGVYCSNGIEWSPDLKEMYYIDSGIREIRAYEFDAAGGTIGARRKAFALPEEVPGVPDGMCMDAEGNLWLALWGGNRIVRCDPVDGSLLGVIELPLDQPTSCAFGGADLSTLYITSARAGLDDAALQRQPLAGGLFQADGLCHGVSGGTVCRFPYRIRI